MRRIFHSSEDEFSEAVKRYEAFMADANTPGYFDVEELEAIVDYYLRKGQTKDSSGALEFGLKLHPHSVSLRTKRAKIYLATGDIQKAYSLLESLAHQDDYEVTLLRVDALQKLGRKEEALRLSDKLVEEASEDLDNICLDIAYIFLTVYDIESAYKYLIIGDDFNPLNEELLYELAFCYEHMEERTKAIETYSRIIKLDAYAAEAWFNLGQMYFAHGQFQESLEAYEYARIISPNDSLTCVQKAHAHFQVSQYQEALEEFFAFEEMTGNSGQSYLFIGEAYERLEQYGDAISFYNKVLQEDKSNYDALIGIGICLLEQDLFEEGLVYLHQALQVKQDDADAWIYFGEALMGMGDTPTALVAFLKSLDYNPDQPDVLLSVANILMDQKEYSLALEYYLEAAEKDEHQELENIHIFLAIAYHFNGDEAASQQSLAKAMEENLDAGKIFEEFVAPQPPKGSY